jgi:hypothetical protein
MTGICGDCNIASGSIIYWEFRDFVGHFEFLKELSKNAVHLQGKVGLDNEVGKTNYRHLESTSAAWHRPITVPARSKA